MLKFIKRSSNKIRDIFANLYLKFIKKEAIKIILIRHCHVDNQDYIFYGRTPGIELNELGLDQSINIAKGLHDELKINDHVLLISSPILRCQQTSQIIFNYLKTKCFLTSKIDENFNEVSNSYEQDMYDPKWDFSNFSEKSIEYETFEEVCMRFKKGIKEIITEKKVYKNVIIITHAELIMAARCFGLKRELSLQNKIELQRDGFYPNYGSRTTLYLNENGKVIHSKIF